MLLCLSLIAVFFAPVDLMLTVVPTGDHAWIATGHMGDSPVTGIALADGADVFLGLTRWPSDAAGAWTAFAAPAPLTLRVSADTLTGRAIHQAVTYHVVPCGKD